MLIDAWRADKRREALWTHIQELAFARRWVSTASLHELLQGKDDPAKLDQRKAQHAWAARHFQLLPLDADADTFLRKYHERLVPGLKTLGDWLIAASAHSRGFAVATTEKKRESFGVLIPLGLEVVIPPRS